MSYYDVLSPIYTFSLCITEEGSTIVDTTVNVKATAEEITRAKQTIQQLIDTYALAIEPPQASEPELWNQPPVDPADQPKPETVHIPPVTLTDNLGRRERPHETEKSLSQKYAALVPDGVRMADLSQLQTEPPPAPGRA